MKFEDLKTVDDIKKYRGSQITDMLDLFGVSKDRHVVIISVLEAAIAEAYARGRLDKASDDENVRKLSAAHLGILGGNATKAKYGKEYFSRIAKGWPKGKKRK